MFEKGTLKAALELYTIIVQYPYITVIIKPWSK